MRKVNVRFILLALLLTFFLPGKQTMAAMQKQKALKVYARLLTKSDIVIGGKNEKLNTASVEFAIGYVDSDSVPELFVRGRNPAGTFASAVYSSIYTFRKGKAVRVASYTGYSYIMEFYKKKGIYTLWLGSEGAWDTYTLFRLSGTKAKKKLRYTTESNVRKDGKVTYNYGYALDGPVVSKKKINTTIKKLVGKRKKTVIRYKANTLSNRKSCLKNAGFPVASTSKGNSVSAGSSSTSTTAKPSANTSTASNSAASTSSSKTSSSSSTSTSSGSTPSSSGSKSSSVGGNGSTTGSASVVQELFITIKGNVSGQRECKLDAEAYPCGTMITWTSSDSTIASVSTDGKLTAKKAGTATIYASVISNEKTYSASKTVTVIENKSYGAWSDWTIDVISSNADREVRTAKVYRYYCFLCPVCGGREPFQGGSDCRQYSLSLANGVVKWSTVPFSDCNPQPYSYTDAKKWTTSLGDGLRWNLSTMDIGRTDYGYQGDAGCSIICTGYSWRSVSRSYSFQ